MFTELFPNLRRGAPALLFLCFGLCGPSLPAQPRPQTSPPSPAEAACIQRLTNELRTGRRLPPVLADRSLCHAARLHAQDMARHGYFGHSRGGGWHADTPGSRAEAQGYRWAVIEENISFGQPSVAGAFSGWVSSHPHYRNLINPTVHDLGLGSAQDDRTGRRYWVLMLGSRAVEMEPSPQAGFSGFTRRF